MAQVRTGRDGDGDKFYDEEEGTGNIDATVEAPDDDVLDEEGRLELDTYERTIKEFAEKAADPFKAVKLEHERWNQKLGSASLSNQEAETKLGGFVHQQAERLNTAATAYARATEQRLKAYSRIDTGLVSKPSTEQYISFLRADRGTTARVDALMFQFQNKEIYSSFYTAAKRPEGKGKTSYDITTQTFSRDFSAQNKEEQATAGSILGPNAAAIEGSAIGGGSSFNIQGVRLPEGQLMHAKLGVLTTTYGTEQRLTRGFIGTGNFTAAVDSPNTSEQALFISIAKEEQLTPAGRFKERYLKDIQNIVTRFRTALMDLQREKQAVSVSSITAKMQVEGTLDKQRVAYGRDALAMVQDILDRAAGSTEDKVLYNIQYIEKFLASSYEVKPAGGKRSITESLLELAKGGRLSIAVSDTSINPELGFTSLMNSLRNNKLGGGKKEIVQELVKQNLFTIVPTRFLHDKAIYVYGDDGRAKELGIGSQNISNEKYTSSSENLEVFARVTNDPIEGDATQTGLQVLGVKNYMEEVYRASAFSGVKSRLFNEDLASPAMVVKAMQQMSRYGVEASTFDETTKGKAFIFEARYAQSQKGSVSAEDYLTGLDLKFRSGYTISTTISEEAGRPIVFLNKGNRVITGAFFKLSNSVDENTVIKVGNKEIRPGQAVQLNALEVLEAVGSTMARAIKYEADFRAPVEVFRAEYQNIDLNAVAQRLGVKERQLRKYQQAIAELLNGSFGGVSTEEREAARFMRVVIEADPTGYLQSIYDKKLQEGTRAAGSAIVASFSQPHERGYISGQGMFAMPVFGMDKQLMDIHGTKSAILLSPYGLSHYETLGELKVSRGIADAGRVETRDKTMMAGGIYSLAGGPVKVTLLQDMARSLRGLSMLERDKYEKEVAAVLDSDTADLLTTELFGTSKELYFYPYAKTEQLSQRLKNLKSERALVESGTGFTDFVKNFGYAPDADSSSFLNALAPERMSVGNIPISMQPEQFEEYKSLIEKYKGDYEGLLKELRTRQLNPLSSLNGLIRGEEMKLFVLNFGFSELSDYGLMNKAYFANKRFIDLQHKSYTLQARDVGNAQDLAMKVRRSLAPGTMFVANDVELDTDSDLYKFLIKEGGAVTDPQATDQEKALQREAKYQLGTGEGQEWMSKAFKLKEEGDKKRIFLKKGVYRPSYESGSYELKKIGTFQEASSLTFIIDGLTGQKRNADGSLEEFYIPLKDNAVARRENEGISVLDDYARVTQEGQTIQVETRAKTSIELRSGMRPTDMKGPSKFVEGEYFTPFAKKTGIKDSSLIAGVLAPSQIKDFNFNAGYRLLTEAEGRFKSPLIDRDIEDADLGRKVAKGLELLLKKAGSGQGSLLQYSSFMEMLTIDRGAIAALKGSSSMEDAFIQTLRGLATEVQETESTNGQQGRDVNEDLAKRLGIAAKEIVRKAMTPDNYINLDGAKTFVSNNATRAAAVLAIGIDFAETLERSRSMNIEAIRQGTLFRNESDMSEMPFNRTTLELYKKISRKPEDQNIVLSKDEAELGPVVKRVLEVKARAFGIGLNDLRKRSDKELEAAFTFLNALEENTVLAAQYFEMGISRIAVATGMQDRTKLESSYAKFMTKEQLSLYALKTPEMESMQRALIDLGMLHDVVLTQRKARAAFSFGAELNLITLGVGEGTAPKINDFKNAFLFISEALGTYTTFNSKDLPSPLGGYIDLPPMLEVAKRFFSEDNRKQNELRKIEEYTQRAQSSNNNGVASKLEAAKDRLSLRFDKELSRMRDYSRMAQSPAQTETEEKLQKSVKYFREEALDRLTEKVSNYLSSSYSKDTREQVVALYQKQKSSPTARNISEGFKKDFLELDIAQKELIADVALKYFESNEPGDFTSVKSKDLNTAVRTVLEERADQSYNQRIEDRIRQAKVKNSMNEGADYLEALDKLDEALRVRPITRKSKEETEENRLKRQQRMDQQSSLLKEVLGSSIVIQLPKLIRTGEQVEGNNRFLLNPTDTIVGARYGKGILDEITLFFHNYSSSALKEQQALQQTIVEAEKAGLFKVMYEATKKPDTDLFLNLTAVQEELYTRLAAQLQASRESIKNLLTSYENIRRTQGDRLPMMGTTFVAVSSFLAGPLESFVGSRANTIIQPAGPGSKEGTSSLGNMLNNMLFSSKSKQAEQAISTAAALRAYSTGETAEEAEANILKTIDRAKEQKPNIKRLETKQLNQMLFGSNENRMGDVFMQGVLTGRTGAPESSAGETAGISKTTRSIEEQNRRAAAVGSSLKIDTDYGSTLMALSAVGYEYTALGDFDGDTFQLAMTKIANITAEINKISQKIDELEDGRRYKMSGNNKTIELEQGYEQEKAELMAQLTKALETATKARQSAEGSAASAIANFTGNYLGIPIEMAKSLGLEDVALLIKQYRDTLSGLTDGASKVDTDYVTKLFSIEDLNQTFDLTKFTGGQYDLSDFKEKSEKFIAAFRSSSGAKETDQPTVKQIIQLAANEAVMEKAESGIASAMNNAAGSVLNDQQVENLQAILGTTGMGMLGKTFNAVTPVTDIALGKFAMAKVLESDKESYTNLMRAIQNEFLSLQRFSEEEFKPREGMERITEKVVEGKKLFPADEARVKNYQRDLEREYAAAYGFSVATQQFMRDAAIKPKKSSSAAGKNETVLDLAEEFDLARKLKDERAEAAANDERDRDGVLAAQKVYERFVREKLGSYIGTNEGGSDIRAFTTLALINEFLGTDKTAGQIIRDKEGAFSTYLKNKRATEDRYTRMSDETFLATVIAEDHDKFRINYILDNVLEASGIDQEINAKARQAARIIKTQVLAGDDEGLIDKLKGIDDKDENFTTKVWRAYLEDTAEKQRGFLVGLLQKNKELTGALRTLRNAPLTAPLQDALTSAREAYINANSLSIAKKRSSPNVMFDFVSNIGALIPKISEELLAQRTTAQDPAERLRTMKAVVTLATGLGLPTDILKGIEQLPEEQRGRFTEKVLNTFLTSDLIEKVTDQAAGLSIKAESSARLALIQEQLAEARRVGDTEAVGRFKQAEQQVIQEAGPIEIPRLLTMSQSINPDLNDMDRIFEESRSTLNKSYEAQYRREYYKTNRQNIRRSHQIAEASSILVIPIMMGMLQGDAGSFESLGMGAMNMVQGALMATSYRNSETARALNPEGVDFKELDRVKQADDRLTYLRVRDFIRSNENPVQGFAQAFAFEAASRASFIAAREAVELFARRTSVDVTGGSGKGRVATEILGAVLGMAVAGVMTDRPIPGTDSSMGDGGAYLGKLIQKMIENVNQTSERFVRSLVEEEDSLEEGISRGEGDLSSQGLSDLEKNQWTGWGPEVEMESDSIEQESINLNEFEPLIA